VRRILLLVALLAVGCARPPMTFRFAGDATPEQRAATAEAMARISPALTPSKRPRLDPRGAYRVSFPERIPTDDGDMGGRECTYVGNDCDDAPSIRVRRNITGAVLVRILMHELLHAAGLKHVPVYGAVMHLSAAASDHLTPADLTECRRVHACPAITTRSVP